MIKRNNIKHGDVVEVELPNKRGFGYLKCIEPKKFNEDAPLTILIYNWQSKEPIEDLGLIDRNLLLAPLWIAGSSAAITKFDWKILVNEDVSEDEMWLPDTKGGWPPLKQSPEKWAYFEQFSTKPIFAEYENVKHLNENVGFSIEGIPYLILMELLKLQDKDIKNDIDTDDWLDEVVYERMADLPSYSKLPQEIQGKVIIN